MKSGKQKGVEAIKKKINAKKSPKSSVLKVKGSIKLVSEKQSIQAENVLCFIEGSDPVLKKEVVVVSAHFDHVGEMNGKIYNGADDDGSGTVTALEIAEAFQTAKKDGNGPKRSVLVLHVSGEEKGLLGSEWYSEYPIFPLESTVCDLNIDMIGRVDDQHKDNEKYVYVIGSDKLSTSLHSISEASNKTYTQLELDYTYNDPNDPNRFYYRSDHYNFAKHNIPVIFYFSGVHEDYHQPGDDPEKIMYEKMSMIGHLIFHTAWEVANRAERLVVDVKSDFE
jgi:Zn-dependent M28 family amino/carboxypeptidase